MSILVAFWGAYAYFPLLAVCAFAFWRGGRLARIAAAAALAIGSVLAYARFIEPRLLISHHETIILPGASDTSPTIRVALFADTHIGVFSNAVPLSRIARRINSEKVDAVFLAGDLTYHVGVEDIAEKFAALGDFEAPLFVVLGNHDGPFLEGRPGDPIFRAIDLAGARVVQNRAIEQAIGGHRVIVAGASELWHRRQNFDFSASLPDGVPVLLLTHNPDTAYVVPDAFAYDLMLAGHTHGGQIRVPFIYRSFIPTTGPFDKELHVFPTPNGDRLVYVTSGTGMIGLPMRFLMPPRIDILTVHLPER